MKFSEVLSVVVVAAVALMGCPPANTGECGADAGTCSNGQVCERVRGGQTMTACFNPVEIHGRVFNATSNAAVVGARIVAIESSGAAASNVAVSEDSGNYTLRIPAERNPDGTIAAAAYTLRADAMNYQSFPGGIRPSLPVDTTMPMAGDGGTVIQNSTTDIGLFALEAAPRGSIAGRVEGNNAGGVLIVGSGSTAVSDLQGNYVLFNVPPGSVTVRGYASGVQLNPATATVTDGARTSDVNLTVASTELSTVSGSLQFVNAGGSTTTSVALVVRETYNAVLDRGEVPRGLRADMVSGAFTISNVPDGEYYVLAAFENDGVVRDPDPGIGGTDLVAVTVPMGTTRTIQLATSFKVTGALAVISPGADRPEAVTAAMPVFTWADDSSEDGYEIRVYDAIGRIVWMDLALPPGRGAMVTATYAGPALVPGTYYQFRVTSWRTRNAMHAPISRTEELRGVFFRPAM